MFSPIHRPRPMRLWESPRFITPRWRSATPWSPAPTCRRIWAGRFGAPVDRFEIPWIINCEKAVVEGAW